MRFHKRQVTHVFDRNSKTHPDHRDQLSRGRNAACKALAFGRSLRSLRNPYAGRYEPDLLPFIAELRSLGTLLAEELVATLGKENVEVYSKAAIAGVDGELEHAAVWHEAGGLAMRSVLGEPKAVVPASKAVAAAGYWLDAGAKQPLPW